MEANTLRMTGVYDLIVVGGGPAGASAAITACAAGRAVLLIDRAAFPRQKVCGEFVSAESLALLAELLGSGQDRLLARAIRISEARLFIDDQTLSTDLDPPAASIARWDLDNALWTSAEKSGVATRPQVTVRNIARADTFQVSTSAGDFESHAVINASGRWSNLTADPAFNAASPAKWLGLKGHFLEPQPSGSVNLYFFDGGYCGVQPVTLQDDDAASSRINACAMVRADVATTMQKVFDQHPLLADRSLKWTPLGDTVSTSPLFFRDPRPVRDGVLMAGDAAGFVDPFIGDGISMALRSGCLAAQSLEPFFLDRISFDNAAAAYHKGYQETLAGVFKTSSRIRRFFELPRAIRKPALAFARVMPGIAGYLVKSTR